MFSRKIIIVIFAGVGLGSSAMAQPAIGTPEKGECSESVYGEWEEWGEWDAGGGTHVTIRDCGNGTPCGTITKFFDPDLPDGNNRNRSLRSRPLLGVKMLYGFKKRRNKRRSIWQRGKIYNPANGKTYRSTIKLETKDQLFVKGCVGPFCEIQR